MKKKLIAIVISTLLAGGIGSAVLYNNYVEKAVDIETAQVIEEETVAEEAAEDIIEENVQEEVLNTENNNDVIENTNTAAEAAPVQKAEVKQEAVQSQNVNKAPAQAQAQPKPQAQQVVNNTSVQNTPSDSFMAQVEQLIYSKVNAERSARGVNQLSYNTTMQKYARIKSQDMGDKNYFDHKDLNGNLITVKMQNDGVRYSAWGENIAYISGASDANQLAQQFMTNWMNSQGHRENILSTNFSSIGIGVYKVGNKVYATQEFYR